MNDLKPIILLTGATGYVGGRLLKELESKGYQVRCLARHPENLKNKVGSKTKVVAGDVLDAKSLDSSFQDVSVAYYLIHSMGSTKDFQKSDRVAAQNFAHACQKAGVQKIVYLGGLGDSQKDLSPHLKSRQEVGEILRAGGIPVIEFRASIIIGSGSLSFEMIRSLVERLPIMVTPKWVRIPAQPISIKDIISYLVGALSIKDLKSHIFEIGGQDIVSYKDIMLEYAHQRGLKRLMIPVPVLTPLLSSLWLGFVTPLYARIGKKLVESIKNPTTVRDDTAKDIFDVKPIGIKQAIAEALQEEDRQLRQTRWCDAISSKGDSHHYGGVRFGNRLVEDRIQKVSVSPEKAFAPIQKIGGKTGWYYGNILWRIRGILDLLIGGVGMRRGRRHPVDIHVGDPIDFWRVEEFVPHQKLRLRAEMKVPGRAWLQFELKPEGHQTIIEQTAIFDPIGLWGQVYWYVLYPIHAVIFSGMIRNIAKSCES